MVDIIIYILTILVTIVPLARDYFNSKDKKIKLTAYSVFLLLSGLILLILGLVKNNNDNESKLVSDRKIDTLRQVVVKVSDTLKSTAERQQKFELVLLKEFGIRKDSITNLPKKADTYNTIINNARTVNIGSGR